MQYSITPHTGEYVMVAAQKIQQSSSSAQPLQLVEPKPELKLKEEMKARSRRRRRRRYGVGSVGSSGLFTLRI